MRGDALGEGVEERAQRRPAEPVMESVHSTFDRGRQMAPATTMSCCKCSEETTDVWLSADCEVFCLCKGCVSRPHVCTGVQ